MQAAVVQAVGAGVLLRPRRHGGAPLQPGDFAGQARQGQGEVAEAAEEVQQPFLGLWVQQGDRLMPTSAWLSSPLAWMKSSGRKCKAEPELRQPVGPAPSGPQRSRWSTAGTPPAVRCQPVHAAVRTRCKPCQVRWASGPTIERGWPGRPRRRRPPPPRSSTPGRAPTAPPAAPAGGLIKASSRGCSTGQPVSSARAWPPTRRKPTRAWPSASRNLAPKRALRR
jgi:hypothetical protein